MKSESSTDIIDIRGQSQQDFNSIMTVKTMRRTSGRYAYQHAEQQVASSNGLLVAEVLRPSAFAGLNVLSLINTHAAAALQFGIERDFTNKSDLVLLYDMGATATVPFNHSINSITLINASMQYMNQCSI